MQRQHILLSQTVVWVLNNSATKNECLKKNTTTGIIKQLCNLYNGSGKYCVICTNTTVLPTVIYYLTAVTNPVVWLWKW